VGSWDPPNSQLRDSMSPADRASLEPIDVRAEVCGILLDGDGIPVAPALAERTIAVRIDQLARVPEVIAVAGGRTKWAALRAVLRAGFVTSLVTDATVANALLERAPPNHAVEAAI